MSLKKVIALCLSSLGSLNLCHATSDDGGAKLDPLSVRIEQLGKKNALAIEQFIMNMHLSYSVNGEVRKTPLYDWPPEEHFPKQQTNQSDEDYSLLIENRVSGYMDKAFTMLDVSMSMIPYKNNQVRIDLSKNSKLEYFADTLEEPLCRNNTDCTAVNLDYYCPQYIPVSNLMHGKAIKHLASAYNARLGGFYDKAEILTKNKSRDLKSCSRKNVSKPSTQCVKNTCILSNNKT